MTRSSAAESSRRLTGSCCWDWNASVAVELVVKRSSESHPSVSCIQSSSALCGLLRWSYCLRRYTDAYRINFIARQMTRLLTYDLLFCWSQCNSIKTRHTTSPFYNCQSPVNNNNWQIFYKIIMLFTAVVHFIGSLICPISKYTEFSMTSDTLQQQH